MSMIVETMLSSFTECKESGSYILFYFLALGFGMAVAWERFGKREPEENWMVEEAKNKIQLWPFLYGALMFALVVGNPLAVWAFHKLTPVTGQYHKMWTLLMPLFLCAYGMVCFLTILREKKQKIYLALGFVLLIGLAGNGFGILSQRTAGEDRQEEAYVAGLIKEKEDALVLAADPVLEYLNVYEPKVKVLYGKDLYTPNLDLGIMDTYADELLHLYETVKQPEGCMGEISNMAFLFDCDIMVIEKFENAPDKAGAFYKKETTEHYIVYMR